MTAAPTIPNLWPDDIKVDAVPPLVILKAQAVGLQERTKGVLDAEVTTTTGTEDFQTHTLYVVAREIDTARRGILSVTHRAEFYPAVVEAKVFELEARKQTVSVTRDRYPYAAAATALALTIKTDEPKHPELARSEPVWPDPKDWRPVAANQEQLIELIGKVFRSVPARSLIESLLARINQQKLAAEAAAQPAA